MALAVESSVFKKYAAARLRCKGILNLRCYSCMAFEQLGINKTDSGTEESISGDTVAPDILEPGGNNQIFSP